MLGYTDEDFTGDLVSSRISKFNYLELNEDVSRQAADEVNQTDCMNIFYNLLKANKKDSNEIYGKILDCELNSDGEINPITILDDARKGPILVHKNFSVSQSVPFDTEDANVFLNGVASTLSAVRSAQQQAGFAVLYYNVKSKTIWAYTTMGWDKDDDSGNNSYILLKGEIKNIYYKSTDVMTPTSVRIEVDKTNSDDSFDSSEDEDSDGYLTDVYKRQMRGYGIPQAAWFTECLTDDMATAIGMDPYEFRMKNCMEDGFVDPANGITFHSYGLKKCMEAGKKYIHWDEKREAYKNQTGPVRRGVGMAIFCYKTGVHPISLETSSVRMVLNQDGSIQVSMGATEIGQGADTVLSLIHI